MMNDGAWIRDGHEQYVRRGKRLSSPAPSTRSATATHHRRRSMIGLAERVMAVLSSGASSRN